MFAIKDQQEFIDDIKKLDEKLEKLRLSSIEVDKKNYRIVYNFICNVTIEEELRNKILDEVEKITPPIFSNVEIAIKKIVSDDALINREIYGYLTKNYPSISIFLKETDVTSQVIGDIVKYTLRLTKDGCEYVRKNGTLIKLNDYLAHNFCSDFAGELEEKAQEETITLLSNDVYASELEKIEHRTIKVLEMRVIDDITMEDLAIYIEDAKDGQIQVCGKITQIAEKTTKTGKPFFIIHLDDTTDTISGVYFTKKGTYQKIKLLQVGDAIICRGAIGDYNGKKSFTIDKINGCTFPENFVKKDRFRMKAPKEYKTIFPTQTETIKVTSVFDENKPLPEELMQNTYVVFDIETTGLDSLNDSITEIGAVKIKDGKICEEWTTLVHPDKTIPAEVTLKTGITMEMVEDKPRIGTVFPDFIKFIEGAILVCHNAEFDPKFMRKYANAFDYEFNNKILDTMVLAREYVPGLKSFGLQALADKFGVVFHHHRALADAYATAECFIEIEKLKCSK